VWLNSDHTTELLVGPSPVTTLQTIATAKLGMNRTGGKAVLHIMCACACVRACARVCVDAGVGVYARTLAYACTSVDLLIQHATRRHIVICGLSGSIIFFDIIS
jgi:hypothetical protein